MSGATGSVSIIGAVSPQGADFSEPVTQNTKRYVRCFLALDKNLAYARHYPAINWTTSYSEYYDDLDRYYTAEVGADWPALRGRLLALLNEESSLQEIVKLIGGDVLPDHQKLTLEVARVIRTGFLQQNAYHKNDTYVPLKKQLLMMQVILYLYDKTNALINEGVAFSDIQATGLFDRLVKMKYEIPNDKLALFDDYFKAIDSAYQTLIQKKPATGAALQGR